MVLRTAELVFQKSFNGAAGQKEWFGKDSDGQVLSGYGISALYCISDDGHIKRPAGRIAAKGAALSFYRCPGFG